MAANWKKTLDDLLYNGDLDGAYNLLDGILRENSGDVKARIAFGKVQYELGDPEKAPGGHPPKAKDVVKRLEQIMTRVRYHGG